MADRRLRVSASILDIESVLKELEGPFSPIYGHIQEQGRNGPTVRTR